MVTQIHAHPPPAFHTLTFLSVCSNPTCCALSVWKCDVLFPLWKCAAFLLLISVQSVMNWVKIILLEMNGRCLSSMWMRRIPDAAVIYIFLLSCPGWCLAEYIRIAKYEKVLILSFIKCWSHVLIAGCVAESADSCWLSLAASLWIFGKAAVCAVSEGWLMALVPSSHSGKVVLTLESRHEINVIVYL